MEGKYQQVFWKLPCHRILVEPLDQVKINIDVYTLEYSVTGLGMNGRKPTCISVTLTGDNNDLTHNHDGIMFFSITLWYNKTLWKQLSINSVVDELSTIWEFVYSSRLITKYIFSDLTMIYISYDGETFILQIVILKRNLTARLSNSAYYNAGKSAISLCITFL